MSANDLFRWSECYNVGIQEVDEQHRVLVSLLNLLHEAICHHHDGDTSREILERLAEYTRTHFALEESLMRRTQYPGLETHRGQHEELARHMLDLQHRLEEGNAGIALELLLFLKTWLTQHIGETDKAFGTFFQTAGLTEYAAWANEVQSTMRKKKWWWKFW